MVSVTLLYRKGKPAGFLAAGHAGYAGHGEDIVCSAVSALTQTALLGLTERLSLPVKYGMEEGNLHCQLGEGLTEQQQEQAAILLDTLRLGLTSMQQGYGTYLNITEREV